MAEINLEHSDFCVNAEAYINEQLLKGFASAKLPDVDLRASKKNMRLALMFTNIRDAVSALHNSGEQHIQVKAATEHFNIETGEMDRFAERHVMIATPKMLIPNWVSPTGKESPCCEYEVVYYAAYVDGKAIMEVDSRNGTCWFMKNIS